jgi:hypothetical protein
LVRIVAQWLTAVRGVHDVDEGFFLDEPLELIEVQKTELLFMVPKQHFSNLFAVLQNMSSLKDVFSQFKA